MTRERIDRFLAALEGERVEIDRKQGSPSALGAVFARDRGLFSADRLTEVQRELAGAVGVEERRLRALLEFLAIGRARAASVEAWDRRVSARILGSAVVGDRRIPLRQVGGTLGRTADPDERRVIDAARVATLAEQAAFAEDHLSRTADAISALGYGSHLDAVRTLTGLDLPALARAGERFLAESEPIYRELLAWHLPRLADVSLDSASAADGDRLLAGAEDTSFLTAGVPHRRLLSTLRESGIELPEPSVQLEWDVFLASSAGSVCYPVEVPDLVRIRVGTRSGRAAVVSFLRALGEGLHHAGTPRALPVEERRLGDPSVPLATGDLLMSLLWNPAALTRIFDLPHSRIESFRRLSALCLLLEVRRCIGILSFEVVYFAGEVGIADGAEIMTRATGLRHDPQHVLWMIDPEFAGVRRLRSIQLGTAFALHLRDQYDEDWFRNPTVGADLRSHFARVRIEPAHDLAPALTGVALGYDAIIRTVAELT